LDEVDGADAKSAISALVEIVKAEIPAKAAKGKKSKKDQTYLRRPIILICNHKHAPALRPILPYCRQFDVQPPNPERLTARLKAVLASEHLRVVMFVVVSTHFNLPVPGRESWMLGRENVRVSQLGAALLWLTFPRH
jgi:DNA polymerase III delta prime subunit